MAAEDKEKSRYYQTIARAYLEHRGAPFFLSPKDQSAIAAWENKRVPLRVVLEGISRTFDSLKARGLATKRVSLSFCERQVEAALAQYRDRSAGRRKAAKPRKEKKDRARREIEKALHSLPPDDLEIARLLQAALGVLAMPEPDEAALGRIDAEVEGLLWARATAADRTAAEAEVRRMLKGRQPENFDDMVRRQVIQASRAGQRIPHVALYYF